jgi:hypothetical protein
MLDGYVISGLAVSPAGQLKSDERAAAEALRLDKQEERYRLCFAFKQLNRGRCVDVQH